MVIGHPKPVPSATFIEALLNSAVPYIRITNYGMKQAIRGFPDLPRDLLQCDTADVGYPENEWNVSFSRRTDYLYMAKATVLCPNAFTPEFYGVNMEYYMVSVPIYIGKAKRIFALARAILTCEGVMRHHVSRLLTGPERNLFGDLKLLLAYRHAGYHTVIGAFNNWWGNDEPEPLRIQPRIPQANTPPAAMDVNDVVINNPVVNRNPNQNPIPLAEQIDTMLILIARDNRSPQGQRRINWARVHASFTRRYPEDGRMKDQLKNRDLSYIVCSTLTF
ncbi:Hypothetical predicted protein, partial [Paramuricea clavata]